MNPKKLTADGLGPVPPLPKDVDPKVASRIRLTHERLRQALVAAEQSETYAGQLRRTADGLTTTYDGLILEAGGQGRLELGDEDDK